MGTIGEYDTEKLNLQSVGSAEWYKVPATAWNSEDGIDTKIG